MKVAVQRFAPLVAMLGAALVARTLYVNRGRYSKSDFAKYYNWSEELRLGGDPWLPGDDPSSRPPPGVRYAGNCNYTPAFCHIFEPLTILPPSSAYWIWQGLMVGALVFGIFLVLRETGPPLAASTYFLAFGAALLFPEVHESLHYAQPTFLLLLLMVGAWASDRRDARAMAGLLLASAALLKVYPALLGMHFLLRRRWSTVGWSIAFTIAGLLLFNVPQEITFLRYCMPRAWVQFSVAQKQERCVCVMGNIYFLLAKIEGASPPFALVTALTLPVDLAIAAAAIAATLRTLPIRELDGLCAGLWIAASLIMSPLAWPHELTLLLPMLLALAVGIARGVPIRSTRLLLLLAGILGVILAYFFPPLQPTHLFFWAALGIYLSGFMIALDWAECGQFNRQVIAIGEFFAKNAHQPGPAAADVGVSRPNSETVGK